MIVKNCGNAYFYGKDLCGCHEIVFFCLVDVKAELLRSHFPSFSHSGASPELGGGGGGGGGWGFVPNASQISVRHEAA